MEADSRRRNFRQTAAFGAVFGRRRVLAMHEVPNARGLESLIRSVRSFWPSVEFTFDDGEHSVVEAALPLLVQYGITATMFVCPGLAESGRPFWWDLVRSAPLAQLPPDLRAIKLNGGDPAGPLKRMPDVERRTILSLLDFETNPPLRSVNKAELHTWLDAGMKVGNHTWDHPCLDRCTEQEQVRQVREAHHWLTEFLGKPPTVFAYPNGDWSQAAEDELLRLGYCEAFLFDHRVGRIGQHPLRQSRLRLHSNASPARARLITSGLHSSLMHARDGARLRLDRARTR